MIRSRYPEATFTVSWGPDNGDAVHLYANVDCINTDLRIPLRTPERNAEVCAHASPSRRMLQARGPRVAA
jgi:hypothetical protein